MQQLFENKNPYHKNYRIICNSESLVHKYHNETITRNTIYKNRIPRIYTIHVNQRVGIFADFEYVIIRMYSLETDKNVVSNEKTGWKKRVQLFHSEILVHHDTTKIKNIKIIFYAKVDDTFLICEDIRAFETRVVKLNDS